MKKRILNTKSAKFLADKKIKLNEELMNNSFKVDSLELSRLFAPNKKPLIVTRLIFLRLQTGQD